MNRIARSALRGTCVMGPLVLLAACAEPHVVTHPEAGIELRWPNSDPLLGSAVAMADARCTPRDERATMTYLSVDRDETLARFMCRAMPDPDGPHSRG